MGKIVHKQIIQIQDFIQVSLPKAAKVVMIAYQGFNLCIWYEFDFQYKDFIEPRCFQVFGTGHLIPEHVKHVATVLSPSHDFVWHIYER